MGPLRLRRLGDGGEPFVPTRFSLTPAGVTVGAHVDGVDLAEASDDGLLDELRRALREWKVLFFGDQHLTPEQHAEFASRWGVLTDDQLEPTTRQNPVDNLVVFTRDAETPGLENGWHSDGTFRPMPTAGTILRAIDVPPAGGDTLFADMAAAYDNLTDEVRQRLRGLVAVHDWSIGGYANKYGDRLERLRTANPPVEHPVAIRHPATGRPTLFVNRMFTREIKGLEREESDGLLDLLCAQAELPELQCRFAWRPGSVAFWDNLACQHYGASDYHPARRVMARATFFDPRYVELRAA